MINGFCFFLLDCVRGKSVNSCFFCYMRAAGVKSSFVRFSRRFIVSSGSNYLIERAGSMFEGKATGGGGLFSMCNAVSALNRGF